MPAKKVRIPLPPSNALVEGVEVDVAETTERWTEVRLSDGSSLRVKPMILGAVRVLGQYDLEGNPVYALKATTTMIVSEAPESLKKNAKAS